MGNQQVTELDLAFLAGLMEGEGCFSLVKRVRTDMRKKYNNTTLPPAINYKPHICVSNTDERMIEDVHQMLDRMEVGHYIQWHGMGLKKGGVNPNTGRFIQPRRSQGQINIFGLKRCEKYLKIVTPYLRYKREQAELLLEWIERRLATPYYKAIAERGKSYDEVDDWYYHRLAELKKSGTSETIRQSHTVRHGVADDGKI